MKNSYGRVSGKERGFPAVAGKEQNLPVGGLLLQKPKGGGAAFVIEIRQLRSSAAPV